MLENMKKQNNIKRKKDKTMTAQISDKYTYKGDKYSIVAISNPINFHRDKAHKRDIYTLLVFLLSFVPLFSPLYYFIIALVVLM